MFGKKTIIAIAPAIAMIQKCLWLICISLTRARGLLFLDDIIEILLSLFERFRHFLGSFLELTDTLAKPSHQFWQFLPAEE